MNVNPVGKGAHTWRNNRLLMPLLLAVFFLAGFYYGGGWISEPYNSWSLKVVLFFLASLLMVGVITILRQYTAKNIDLEAMERKNAERKLEMATICFVISAVIGAILLMFTNPIDPIDSPLYGLYGGMLVSLAFGIAILGIFAVSSSQNIRR